MYVGKKGEVPSTNVEAHAGVTNPKESRHGKETAKQTVDKGNLSSPREPSKMTNILPRGGFGSIVANVNKQKPLEARLTEQCGQYSRVEGASGVLRKQTVSDKAVKKTRAKQRW